MRNLKGLHASFLNSHKSIIQIFVLALALAYYLFQSSDLIKQGTCFMYFKNHFS